jgi:hypothetical protein
VDPRRLDSGKHRKHEQNTHLTTTNTFNNVWHGGDRKNFDFAIPLQLIFFSPISHSHERSEEDHCEFEEIKYQCQA